MSKALAKQLQRDFIPNGHQSVDPQTLDWRETKEDEVFQCCRQTTHDPQSGPIYCGRVADFVAFVPGGDHAAVCRRHFSQVWLKKGADNEDG